MVIEPAPALAPEVPGPVRAQAWLQQVPQVDARLVNELGDFCKLECHASRCNPFIYKICSKESDHLWRICTVNIFHKCRRQSKHYNSVHCREQVRMSVWENIEQAQRESIIMDISELVQAQLVTQTLSGGFRNTLEARMRVSKKIACVGIFC